MARLDFKCRWSPTLGRLESTHELIWGTKAYNPETNKEDPCVFFGIYGLPDFYTLWRHKGKRYVLWAGTDIIHFENGYWLDEVGKIRIDNKALAQWIDTNCENWCENEVEQERLFKLGISCRVCPSFLGDVNNFPITYQYNRRPKVYSSVSGDNFEMYGWPTIERIAGKCEVDFYLYGNTKKWKTKHKNVKVIGRVPQEQFNEEIKEMQCGLRPLDFDGFSEVLGKAVLMGQYPISRIKYVHIDHYSTDESLISFLNKLVRRYRPNIKARNFYLKTFNQYPWNQK